MSSRKYDTKSGQRGTKQRRGTIDPVVLSVFLITVVLLGTVVYLGLRAGAMTSVASDDRVDLVLSATSHDWGSIPMGEGNVTTHFEITNSGTAPLFLYDVATSCMCTTAQLQTVHSSSRVFGMHEKGGDVFEVAPGETALLLVEFDPASHGVAGLGPVIRLVNMSTNAPAAPQLLFQLTANVTSE